jgi:hypothetical protein
MKSIQSVRGASFPKSFHVARSGAVGLLLAGLAFSGTVLAGPNKPDIAVEQPVGSGMKDGVAKRSFGTVALGKTSATKNFKIKNTGYADLTGLRVVKIGGDVSDFIVGPVGALLIRPGKGTVFKVQFKPRGKREGIRSTKLRIFSNDPNENPFDITVTGEAVK